MQGFVAWGREFLKSGAMVALSDHLNTEGEAVSSSVEGSPLLFYETAPTYRQFERIILSSCYLAVTCPKVDEADRKRGALKSAELDLRGLGRNALKEIDSLRMLNRRYSDEFSWALARVSVDLKKECGIEIISRKEQSYSRVFDLILGALSDELQTRATPTMPQEHFAANLRFPEPVERIRKDAVVDGLIYELAYLIDDWKNGRREAYAMGYGVSLRKGARRFSGLIALLVNETLNLREPIDEKVVSMRLKALRREGVTLHSWPHQLEK